MGPKRLAAILRDIASRIDRSENPSVSLVTEDLRRLMAALRVSTIPMHPATKDVEQALYGHSGGDPQAGGSSIWWLVFNEIGMEDWTPVTDYAAVEAKAKELLAEWSKGWSEKFTPEEKQQRIERSLKSLKGNWDEYQKSYMPEHMKILEEKGLAGPSPNPGSIEPPAA